MLNEQFERTDWRTKCEHEASFVINEILMLSSFEHLLVVVALGHLVRGSLHLPSRLQVKCSSSQAKPSAQQNT